MLKEIFFVGIGSFIGGSARYIISRIIQSYAILTFPLWTFVVNILGCLILGFLSGLNFGGNWLSPSTKLILTTGFCGGFTTFSTFMNESNTLLKDGNSLQFAIYIIASITVGLLAVVIGQQLAKSIA